MKKPLLYFLIFTLGTAFADSTVEHRSVTEPYVDPELKVSFPAKAGAFQKNEVSRSYNPMIGSKIRYSDHDGYCADVFLYTLPGKSNSIAPADLEVHYKTVKEAILKLNVQSPSINSVTLLEEKKKKLLDLRLENLLKAEDFELKYSEISAKIEQNAMRLIELKEAEERRTLIKERVTEFRRLLQKNEILTKFDRTIFESIVENVIIGGFDEKGCKDPYQISFVYKMGFSDLVNAKKTEFRERFE